MDDSVRHTVGSGGGSRPGLGRTGWWPARGPGQAQGRGQGQGQGRGRGHGRGPARGPGRGHGHGHGHGGGPGPTGEILFFAWTLDGTEPTSQEDVFGVDVVSGTVRRLTDHSSGVPFVSDRDPAWSPGRDRVVFMSSDAVAPTHLQVVTAAGSPVADLPVEGATPVWLDGSTVVCSVHRPGPGGAFDRADLVAVDVPGGAAHAITDVAPGEYLGEPAWHPVAGLVATLSVEDPVTTTWLGQRLAVADPASVAAVLAGGAPLSSGDLVEIAPGHQWPAGPAWSPDGSRLAFSATRPCATTSPDGVPVPQMDVAVLTLATGAVTWVTDDTTGDYDDGLNDGSPAFSPDGRWLAWARGHEDDWTRIMVDRLDHPGPPSVLLDGSRWFRWGLAW